MASSNTYNFQLTNSDLLLDAFDRAKVRPAAITSEHMVSARRSLNLELQRWANKGPLLWAVDLQTVPLVAGQSTYTVPANTIDILDVYYQTPQSSGGFIDRIMEPVSRTDYASYANKTLAGTPTVYWFDRLNAPTITIWQPPSNGSPYQFSYYRWRRLQDANLGSGETPDINYRFQDAFCAGLAARLAEKFSDAATEQKLRITAQQAWEESSLEDRERTAVHITPRLTGYWN